MKKKAPQEESNAGDYKVGYGRPPKDTRFQPGCSGNPKGRPKGTKNLKADLIEELGERILVREGEQAKQVSKQRALIKTLMAQTLKGNARAASLLLTMMMRLLDTGEVADDLAKPSLEDELEIIRGFEARLRRGEAATPSLDGDDTSQESPS
jgi:hypothetical protein